MTPLFNLIVVAGASLAVALPLVTKEANASTCADNGVEVVKDNRILVSTLSVYDLENPNFSWENDPQSRYYHLGDNGGLAEYNGFDLQYWVCSLKIVPNSKGSTFNVSITFSNFDPSHLWYISFKYGYSSGSHLSKDFLLPPCANLENYSSKTFNVTATAKDYNGNPYVLGGGVCQAYDITLKGYCAISTSSAGAYDLGYEDGHASGYTEGNADGQATAQKDLDGFANIIPNIFGSVVGFFDSLASFEIFGISLFSIIALVAGLGFVIVIIKWVIKGNG